MQRKLHNLRPLAGLGLIMTGLAVGPQARAQDEGFEALDLDSLLNMEVSVASLKAMSLRESPGIVSVVTRDDMLSWGARDLVDVLRMVPGFYLGVDVQGAVGVGIRGNWAHEGKVLLLIDGFEINELDYQTLNLGHHYPVENLERIEIIRGPGSAIYGGNAELGVIRVVTRGAAELEGGRISARYGMPSEFYGGGDKFGFGDLTLEAGMTHGDFSWSASGFIGRSTRSEADYTPILGDPYDMDKNSSQRPLLLNAAAGYKKTKLRLMFDGFTYSSKDAFDEPTEYAHGYRFGGFYADLSSSFELAPGLTLSPKLSFKRQEPYYTTWDNDEQRAELLDFGLYLQHAVMRTLANVTVSWDMFDKANLIVGAEAFYDRGDRIGNDADAEETNSYTDAEGNYVDKIDFFTTALFTQFLWPNDYVNVTAGGRLEIHSVFGVFAVPRVALTKVFDFGLHAKLLASQAFRTPSLQNKSLEKLVDPNNEVSRERTTVFEAEVGYQVLDGLQVTANAFYTRIDDPIIYLYDEATDSETYVNGTAAQTAGAELQVDLRFARVRGQASYSYYTTVGEVVEDYAVPDHKARLGAPQHKLTTRLQVEVFPRIFVTPTLVFQSQRYGFTVANEEAPVRIDDQVLLGLGISAQDLGMPGLEAGLFAHNLLDQTETFIQPYFGGHGPLPGPGRQIMLRLAYRLDR
ncbi:MAG: TonB-dependent receptor plug domain-containing protein [Deltaproteobacteria bacterium]|nr:TonB-dependent receptor plug domain-containing protein [Deltaproteobacteria bacterium]